MDYKFLAHPSPESGRFSPEEGKVEGIWIEEAPNAVVNRDFTENAGNRGIK